ncbi:MAG: hypothetical protein ACQESR_11620 [Planctomycetota bacterium]
MESCPTQAVLPLVGLAAENVIRDRYISGIPAGERARKKRGRTPFLSVKKLLGARTRFRDGL